MQENCFLFCFSAAAAAAEKEMEHVATTTQLRSSRDLPGKESGGDRTTATGAHANYILR